MTTVATLVIEYIAKIDKLNNAVIAAASNMQTIQNAAKQSSNVTTAHFSATSGAISNVAKTANVASGPVSKLSLLQAKAAVAASQLDVAQKNAALALKKATDTANDASASAQAVALAQSKAALAAGRVAVAQHNAASAMDKAQAEADRLAASLKNASSSSNIFSRGINAVKSSVDAMTSRVTHSASSMLDFASKTGMAFIGLKSMAQTAMSTASSLLEPVQSAEQLGIAFTTLMGSAKGATAMIKKLNHFADVTPFEPKDVQQYAAQLIGMKISAGDTIPIMTALGDALFGIGHGTADEMKSVVDIIGKISIAGKMTYGDLSQLSTHGIDAAGAIGAAMGKTTEEVRNLASDGLLPAKDAIDALTKGIEMNPLYQGGMAKQAASLGGIMSTLRGYIDKATNSFLGIDNGMVRSGSLIDQAKQAISNLGMAISSPKFQDFATTMGEKVGGAIKTTASFIQTQMVPAIQNIAENGQKVVSFFRENEAAMIAFQVTGGVVAGVFTAIAIAAAAAAIAESAAMWPILLIAAAIGGLAAGFMLLYNNVAPFREFMNGLGATFMSVWNTIVANFIPVMQQIGSVFMNNVMPILQKIGDFLVVTFAPVWQQLVTTWQTQLLPTIQQMAPIMQPLQTLLTALAVIVGGVLVVALAVLVGILQGVAQGFAALLVGAVQAIGGVVQFIMGGVQIISGLLALLVDIFTGQWGRIGTDLQVIWAGILNMLGGFGNTFMGIVGGLCLTVWGLLSGFVMGIIGFFQGLFNTLVGHSIIPDMVNAIVNWFQQLPSRVGAAIQAMAGTVIGFLGGLASSALNTASNIVNGIISWFAQLPGRAMGALASLPSLLSGFFSSLAASALSGGANIVNSIADGIRGAIGAVSSAIGTVTQFIADHLPHSPAKIGPLKGLLERGSEISNQISKGMIKGVPDVEKAIGRVAMPIAFNLKAMDFAPMQYKAKDYRGAPSNPVVNVLNENATQIYLDGREITGQVQTRVLKESRRGPIRA